MNQSPRPLGLDRGAERIGDGVTSMSHDMQNVVGGILLVVSLLGIEWWQYKNGVSMGPWPLQSLFNTWRPAAYRETDPDSFWRNIVYALFRILIIVVIVLIGARNLGWI